jgi:hypothetical protein
VEAAGLLLVGALVGYFVRLTEFRREKCLDAYASVAGTFLGAAHAGAALHSMYTQLGDQMASEPYRDEARGYWMAWGDAKEEFEAAVARVRMIGSDDMIGATEGLEDFIRANVESVPPLRRTSGTDGWGEAAKVGPAEVDRQCVKLAREFADLGRTEISRRRWLRRRRALRP